MTVVERFLKLVSYPTTSDEASETCPSTARQLALAQELVRQMQDMGIADAHVDQDGYVYGTVPANCDKKIPVYGLIAHMDTSPDAPGENIRARITEPYDGGDVVLNEEKNIVLSPAEYPQLKNSVGKRLIVTDGTTLLGADDKAGIAEIMTLLEVLAATGAPHLPPLDAEVYEGGGTSEQIETIRAVHDYLTQHLSSRVTIDELSRRFLMNPSTMKALFKSVYGSSLASHIREHRMQHAAKLLLEGDENVAQVARAVGYESQSKFSTEFHKAFGVLPTEYRRSQKK